MNKKSAILLIFITGIFSYILGAYSQLKTANSHVLAQRDIADRLTPTPTNPQPPISPTGRHIPTLRPTLPPRPSTSPTAAVSLPPPVPSCLVDFDADGDFDINDMQIFINEARNNPACYSGGITEGGRR